jgi:hypothetical protein
MHASREMLVNSPLPHGLVQRHQNAQDAENDACNGRWRVADALVDGRSLQEDGRRCGEAWKARVLTKSALPSLSKGRAADFDVHLRIAKYRDA